MEGWLFFVGGGLIFQIYVDILEFNECKQNESNKMFKMECLGNRGGK